MKVDPESKIRDYEHVVELASRSREPLDTNSIQKIEEMIQDVTGVPDDPVYRVNCLQLIADLACSHQALTILEDRKVPELLCTLLNESDPLIIPHALKFFYRVNPAYLENKYPQVLNKICDFCQSDSRQLLDYSIDFIASVGRGGFAARSVLDRHPRFKDECLTRLGSTIISSDSLLKSRTLRCIGDLLEIHDDDPREESVHLSERFYHTIISDTEWGQRELAAHQDFVKWLLDRSTETCKESKEAKFEILKTLVKSKTTSRIFTGEDYLKMRADFKNGPFHVGIAEEMLVDNQQAS